MTGFKFTRAQRSVLVLLAALVVLVLFALAFTAGRISAAPVHPAEYSADAGFARDMQVHHAQAVNMAMLVRDRTDSEEIRSLAYDIALTQQHQIGQMHAWLQEWGLPHSASGPRMAWMHHGGGDHGDGGSHHGGGGHHGGSSHSSGTDGALPAGEPMPGMATPEQMRSLDRSTGAEAERRFLTLMIEHHRAGIVMAQAAVDHAEAEQVRRLARSMVTAQAWEIAAMKGLLKAVR